jgi:uncharacterized membrane protein YccC
LAKTRISGKSFKRLLLSLASIVLMLVIIGISPLTSNAAAASTQLSIYTLLTPAQVYQLITSDSSVIVWWMIKQH